MNQHEIAVSALAGAGAGAATVIMGVHVDALVLGLVAALCVSTWLGGMDSNIKVAAATIFSALLAGYGSPVLAEYAARSVPEVAGNLDALRLLSAPVIGGVVPMLFPLAIKVMSNKIGGAA